MSVHSSGEAALSEPAKQFELALVLVNFDSGDHLRNRISKLRPATGEVAVEIVVVDNASTDGISDGIAEIDPEVTVLCNSLNRGYGRACNQGFKSSSAPFVCFLNPDIVPEAGSLSGMLQAIGERPEVSVLGPRLVNPDGSIYPSCRVVPKLGVAMGHAVFGLFTDNNRFTRAYKLIDVNHDAEQEVDWVSGAAMVVRKAFAQVGGFDEGSFMYVEAWICVPG
ncbi:hypothetical protein BH23ACT12_BH23ACT12_03250 [soil metagenome]